MIGRGKGKHNIVEIGVKIVLVGKQKTDTIRGEKREEGSLAN